MAHPVATQMNAPLRSSGEEPLGEAIKADNDDLPSPGSDGRQFVYFQFEWLI